MDKDSLLEIFNNQFKEFVNDISLVFPDNKDIFTLKVTIGQLFLIAPKTLYKSFKKYVVVPYRNEILAGDINFFIDKDYNSDLNRLGGGTNNMILEKIDCLRGPVRDMNVIEQAKVIKYMQNMIKISDLYEV